MLFSLQAAIHLKDIPGGTVKKKKNPPVNAGDASSVPGSGIYPKVGNGNLLQYSCMENSMERGAWQATVHEVANTYTRIPLKLTQHCKSTLYFI